MDYYKKYILYKKKYIRLKNNQIGGSQKDIFPNSVPFKPEIEPKLLPYNKEKIEKLFPKTKNMKNLQLSNIGEYSMSKPFVAEEISKIILRYFSEKEKVTITDANGNMGGNSINFSKYFDKVNTVEILPFHCDILKNNIKQYDHTKNINIICADYLDKIESLEQDVVFFDPPWGGTDYKKNKFLDLYLNKVHMADIINYLLNKTKYVAMRVPRNFNFSTFLKKLQSNKIDIHKVYFKKNSMKKFKVLNYYMLIISK